MAQRTTQKRRPAPTGKTRAGRPGGPVTERPRWAVPLLVAIGLAMVIGVAWIIRATATSPTGNPLADDPGVSHVHGLGVDPADGTLYAATHYGLFRIPESGPAVRVADRYQDTMGFTVVGPGTFLGSGHPDLRERDKPTRLGLIESTDAGQSWTELSLGGQADFHALEAAHDRVYGYDASSGRFLVSTDRRQWDTRALLPMYDFAVSPTDPNLILASTENGLARSGDGGQTFAVVPGAPPLVVLSWPVPDSLYGVTIAGAVLVSADSGTTWTQRGSLDGQPQALTATDASTVHAATDTGIYTSTDGGRTFTLRYRD